MNINKRIYLSSTKPVTYLCELPLLVLLILAIRFNGSAAAPIRLYPLIVATAGAMIFIFIFFYRVISLSVEEVRMFGRFSSRDRALINKGKILKLSFRGRDRLKVELFDDDSTLPELDFLRNDPSYKPCGLNLFRETARCGWKRVVKILRFFGINESDADKIYNEDTFSAEYEGFILSSKKDEESICISIEFTETL